MGISACVGRAALIAALAGLSAGQAPAVAVDRLDYQVTYRGVFSLGQEMPIADLALETRALDGNPRLRETRLEATSAAYTAVESLYPIRYRYRTWSTAEGGELIGFETYEKTSKLRHRLYLGDASDLGVRPLDLAAGAGRHEIAQLDAGHSPVSAVAQQDLVDRLGLLQRIRAQELHDKAQFQFAVTNGREPFVYRVSVEGAHLLPLGGRRFPAWKLRLDGIKDVPGGTQEAVHRPVYIWVTRTTERIPLRADSHHPVGLFRIELKPPADLGHVAQTDP